MKKLGMVIRAMKRKKEFAQSYSFFLQMLLSHLFASLQLLGTETQSADIDKGYFLQTPWKRGRERSGDGLKNHVA